MKSWLEMRLARAGLIAVACILSLPALAEEKTPTDKLFQDQPAAHALYTRMVGTMQKATTLSWTSDFHYEAKGSVFNHVSYKIWLKKPNYARMEVTSAGQSDPMGILVGDGDYFWIYWPKDKPRCGWETGKYAEEYEKYRHTYYMQERTPVGRHSISHAAANVGSGMTIIDPSTFHGYTDSLQPYLDGVRSMGTEKVGDESCDEVEVSFMKHQRSWYLWLSQRDHLPHKLKEVVRVSYDLIVAETWTNVTLNAPMTSNLFVWSPPPGWKQFRQPNVEAGLLKSGEPAPDFELAGADGGKITLSGFRGQIVWLNKWRCG